MIIWCSYCQKYIGEKAPYDDYSMTHSVCKSCYKEIQSDFDKTVKLSIEFKKLRIIYDSISIDISRSNFASLDRHFNALLQMDLDPVDIVFGVVQPLLYKLGKLWELGKVNVYEEHIVTDILLSKIEDLVGKTRLSVSNLKTQERPDVLLSCVNGNNHSIGVKMLEIYLALNDISTLTILPGVPNRELVKLVTRAQPEVLALSISLPWHLDEIEKILSMLQEVEEEHSLNKVVVGGYPFRIGMKIPDGMNCQGISDFTAFLNEIKQFAGGVNG